MSESASNGIGKGRIEALADGVFAIAMTLLVLDVKVPAVDGSLDAAGFARALWQLGPRFFAFVVSFLIAGVFWLGHHALMHYVRRADRLFMRSNLLFLLFISTIPFSASLLGQYSLKMRGGDPVAFSPDGKRFGSYSEDGSLKVWDAQTGQELLTFQAGGVTNLVFSPDGRRLASTSGAGPASLGEVKLWDARTGQELLTFKDGGMGSSVAFSPDGHRLASSSNGTVKIYDATPPPDKP